MTPTELTSLGDVMEITSGFAFKSSYFSDNGSGLPLVRIRDVARGYSETLYNGSYDKRFLVENGDLLVSMDGEFRVKPWTGGAALLNQRVCRLEPDSSQLDKEYLKYLVAPILSRIEDRTPFVTVKHLAAKTLLTQAVSLPPLEEQKRIAAILDKADAIRRKRENTADALTDLRESAIRELVGDLVLNPKGWPQTPLSELVSPDRKITYGILKPGDHAPNGIAMLRIQDIRDGQIVTDDPHRVSSALSEQYKRTILQGGEIVISLVGTIGQVARVPAELKGANVHRNLGVIAPSDAVNSGFLHRIMASRGFADVLIRSTTGGVQALLNLGALNDVLIPVPPRPIQDQLEKFHARLDVASMRQQEAADQSDDLFNSLVQRAFKGEL